jgi:DNA-binding response OmpR family regulator
VRDYHANTRGQPEKWYTLIPKTNLYQPDAATLCAGSIVIQTDKWVVRVAGTKVELTYIEYLLLKQLILERGRVISRHDLLQRVWSYGNAEALETRTVDVHIGRLRKKLGASGEQIITVRGVGYRMNLTPEWISR